MTSRLLSCIGFEQFRVLVDISFLFLQSQLLLQHVSRLSSDIITTPILVCYWARKRSVRWISNEVESLSREMKASRLLRTIGQDGSRVVLMWCKS